MSMKQTQPPAQWRDDINDWLDSLRAAGLSYETIRCRRCKMTHIAIGLDIPPCEVTGDILIRWMAAQHWKPETRKGYRNTVNSFFSWMNRVGKRDDNPASVLPAVKRPKPHPRPCPDKYIIRALHDATPVERIMLRLGAECGLRLSEIAAVKSDDVMETPNGALLLVNGKGDKQRIVPIDDDLAKSILDANGWMFPGRWSGHAEKSYISRHIHRLLPNGWGPHSLRHRYATVTYEATHDLLLVSRLLGHSSVETTQMYVAMPDARLRAGMDAVRLVS